MKNGKYTATEALKIQSFIFNLPTNLSNVREEGIYRLPTNTDLFDIFNTTLLPMLMDPKLDFKNARQEILTKIEEHNREFSKKVDTLSKSKVFDTHFFANLLKRTVTSAILFDKKVAKELRDNICLTLKLNAIKNEPVDSCTEQAKQQNIELSPELQTILSNLWLEFMHNLHKIPCYQAIESIHNFIHHCKQSLAYAENKNTEVLICKMIGSSLLQFLNIEDPNDPNLYQYHNFMAKFGLLVLRLNIYDFECAKIDYDKLGYTPSPFPEQTTKDKRKSGFFGFIKHKVSSGSLKDSSSGIQDPTTDVQDSDLTEKVESLSINDTTDEKKQTEILVFNPIYKGNIPCRPRSSSINEAGSLRDNKKSNDIVRPNSSSEPNLHPQIRMS